MPKDTLNEREFELINIVGAKLTASQRDLSRHMDMSLGMTNMLIRRLIAKGFIRIRQLNKRKVEYLLTPKGLTEKMQKSVRYTLKTLQSMTLIKDGIRKIVSRLYGEGVRDFTVLGRSDFALLIDAVFQQEGYRDYTLTYVDEVPLEVKGVLLICKEKVKVNGHLNGKAIDLLYEVAKDNQLISVKDI